MVSLPRTCDRCGEKMMHYGRCKCMPGTLTITYGNRSVTVDPIDEQPKFKANMDKAETLLNEITETFAARRRS